MGPQQRDARPLSAKFKEDFAYHTLKDRLPVILTKTVDTVYRSRATIEESHGEEGLEDLKVIVGALSKLRSEMQTDKPLSLLSNGGTDQDIWNAYLEKVTKEFAAEDQGVKPSWFKVTWLYFECYAYRRVYEGILASRVLKHLDPYGEQKKAAFNQSVIATEGLLNHLKSVSSNIGVDGKLSIRKAFDQFLLVALWGNKCDLSISNGSDNSQTTDPLGQLEEYNKYILVNDTQEIWNTFQSAGQKNPGNVKLSVVLDNSAFELVTDLVLAEFLMAVGLVNGVHFHGKAMPWFISDVTKEDWEWTLNEFVTSSKSVFSDYGKKWKQYLADGTWAVSCEDFWTLPYAHHEMKQVDTNLYEMLGKSDLAVFKGDLNYRKLTQDKKWDPTTSFEFALGGFHPTPLFALRTVKADTVVGLEPGQAEKCRDHQENWITSGDYAVIQFNSTRTN